MTDLKTKKSIVIYFSRADENYWVWYIEKWNTEVIAEYIQELTWADLFKVERKTPYAKDYNTCIKEAQDEAVILGTHDTKIRHIVSDNIEKCIRFRWTLQKRELEK